MSSTFSTTRFLVALPLAMIAQATAQPTPTAPMPPASTLLQKGPYQPTYESMKQYRTPDWFRDAKFGIWSHWGVNSLPGGDNFFPKQIYVQGSGDYKLHLEKYGHPSKQGYKDIIPLWKAEQWDPDELMKLYSKAGAKYFVSLAVHHDNFDLWNSKYQPKWNSVNMGPQRDIVAGWQKAAKKAGLPFGVSEHLGASYTWWQTNKGADKTGPLAGVPYDGADPAYEDLYHHKAATDDTGWYTNDPANQRDWFNRIKDLVDEYHPDLLYSDGGVPFPESAGLPLLAHFYYSNLKDHNGQMTAVYNCKQYPEGGGWVLDMERGVGSNINPLPWQTDTSIGEWFYHPNDKYKSADTVIQMLCDIVSKNGNMLMNVVQRADGTIEEEPRAVLNEMAIWMPVNGEAIFGTRPWLVFGEGAPSITGASFSENQLQYTSDDVRFTTKEDTLYALILGWPENKRVVIKALALGSPGLLKDPTNVQLLGYKDALKWKRTAAGLEVELPMAAPTEHAVALKISGVKSPASLSSDSLTQWNKFLMPPPDQTVSADTNGILNLVADKADMRGDNIKIGKDTISTFIGWWDTSSDWISWPKVKLTNPGKYRVSAEIAAYSATSAFTISINGQTLKGNAPATDDWYKYQTVELGEVTLNKTSEMKVEMRAETKDWQAINVRAVHLTPVEFVKNG